MGLTSGIKSFLVQKFWVPVTDESVYYNPFNTAAYSVIFALAAAYIGYPLLDRLKIDLDREFFLGIAPYIFLGGALRSLKDVDIVNTILLETPFIYIVMFSFTIGMLLASRKMEEITDRSYHRFFGASGIIALASVLSLYTVSNVSALIEVAAIFSGVLVLGFGVLKLGYPSLLNYSFTVPVASHYWDASTSAIALTYGAEEKHVLARHFVELMGPAGMFVMKTLVIVPAVYYINEEFEGRKKRYYLFLVALLGIALGTRNLVSLVA